MDRGHHIPVDWKVMNQGYEVAGWVVIYLSGFEPGAEWTVSSKLFREACDAIDYARSIAQSRMPRVKALRWNEDKPS